MTKKTPEKVYPARIKRVSFFDRLPINLNKFAKEILKKYEHCSFPDNLALPVLPNQLMNRYLKHLCETKADAMKLFEQEMER